MSVLSLLRILQVSSANLPVGGFTYSQGLEWAVEAKWITTPNENENWLTMQMQTTLRYCDIPLLTRLYHALLANDLVQIQYWSDFLLSCRETAELRAEEQQRGAAFIRFLQGLPAFRLPEEALLPSIKQSQLAGLAYYCVQEKISLSILHTSWCYSWLESNIMAAIKLVPLGQQAGQQQLYKLSQQLPSIIEQANQINDADLGSGSPLVAIASSCHETQYTRLFRS